MAKKVKFYYTFQVVKEPDPGDEKLSGWLFNCHKWDELGGNQPIETYKVNTAHHAFGGCSCPAWKRDCKHLKCVMELLDFGRQHEAWKWRWDEVHGWLGVDDIKSVEDLLDDEDE
jgi:hypothetical protein